VRLALALAALAAGTAAGWLLAGWLLDRRAHGEFAAATVADFECGHEPGDASCMICDPVTRNGRH